MMDLGVMGGVCAQTNACRWKSDIESYDHGENATPGDMEMNTMMKMRATMEMRVTMERENDDGA